MDLPAWVAAGLVDFLTLCPFLTTNWRIPFGEFRDWIGGPGATIYGGFDYSYGTAMHHPESLRGICGSLHDQGADGVYLFNFPCWIERIAATPYDWLTGLGDPATASDGPVLLAADHARHRKTLVDGPAVVPLEIAPGDSAEVLLHVPASALPRRRCLALVHSGGDVALDVAGRRARPRPYRKSAGRSELFVEYYDRQWMPDARPEPAACRVFTVDPDTLSAGPVPVRVTNTSAGPLTIDRVQLGLW